MLRHAGARLQRSSALIAVLVRLRNHCTRHTSASNKKHIKSNSISSRPVSGSSSLGDQPYFTHSVSSSSATPKQPSLSSSSSSSSEIHSDDGIPTNVPLDQQNEAQAPAMIHTSTAVDSAFSRRALPPHSFSLYSSGNDGSTTDVARASAQRLLGNPTTTLLQLSEVSPSSAGFAIEAGKLLALASFFAMPTTAPVVQLILQWIVAHVSLLHTPRQIMSLCVPVMTLPDGATRGKAFVLRHLADPLLQSLRAMHRADASDKDNVHRNEHGRAEQASHRNDILQTAPLSTSFSSPLLPCNENDCAYRTGEDELLQQQQRTAVSSVFNFLARLLQMSEEGVRDGSDHRSNGNAVALLHRVDALHCAACVALKSLLHDAPSHRGEVLLPCAIAYMNAHVLLHQAVFSSDAAFTAREAGRRGDGENNVHEQCGDGLQEHSAGTTCATERYMFCSEANMVSMLDTIDTRLRALGRMSVPRVREVVSLIHVIARMRVCVQQTNSPSSSAILSLHSLECACLLLLPCAMSVATIREICLVVQLLHNNILKDLGNTNSANGRRNSIDTNTSNDTNNCSNAYDDVPDYRAHNAHDSAETNVGQVVLPQRKRSNMVQREFARAILRAMRPQLFLIADAHPDQLGCMESSVLLRYFTLWQRPNSTNVNNGHASLASAPTSNVTTDTAPTKRTSAPARKDRDLLDKIKLDSSARGSAPASSTVSHAATAELVSDDMIALLCRTFEAHVACATAVQLSAFLHSLVRMTRQPRCEDGRALSPQLIDRCGQRAQELIQAAASALASVSADVSSSSSTAATGCHHASCSPFPASATPMVTITAMEAAQLLALLAELRYRDGDALFRSAEPLLQQPTWTRNKHPQGVTSKNATDTEPSDAEANDALTRGTRGTEVGAAAHELDCGAEEEDDREGAFAAAAAVESEAVSRLRALQLFARHRAAAKKDRLGFAQVSHPSQEEKVRDNASLSTDAVRPAHTSDPRRGAEHIAGAQVQDDGASDDVSVRLTRVCEALVRQLGTAMTTAHTRTPRLFVSCARVLLAEQGADDMDRRRSCCTTRALRNRVQDDMPDPRAHSHGNGVATTEMAAMSTHDFVAGVAAVTPQCNEEEAAYLATAVSALSKCDHSSDGATRAAKQQGQDRPKTATLHRQATHDARYSRAAPAMGNRKRTHKDAGCARNDQVRDSDAHASVLHGAHAPMEQKYVDPTTRMAQRVVHELILRVCPARRVTATSRQHSNASYATVDQLKRLIDAARVVRLPSELPASLWLTLSSALYAAVPLRDTALSFFPFAAMQSAPSTSSQQGTPVRTRSATASSASRAPTLSLSECLRLGRSLRAHLSRTLVRAQKEEADTQSQAALCAALTAYTHACVVVTQHTLHMEPILLARHVVDVMYILVQLSRVSATLYSARPATIATVGSTAEAAVPRAAAAAAAAAPTRVGQIALPEQQQSRTAVPWDAFHVTARHAVGQLCDVMHAVLLTHDRHDNTSKNDVHSDAIHVQSHHRTCENSNNSDDGPIPPAQALLDDRQLHSFARCVQHARVTVSPRLWGILLRHLHRRPSDADAAAVCDSVRLLSVLLPSVYGVARFHPHTDALEQSTSCTYHVPCSLPEGNDVLRDWLTVTQRRLCANGTMRECEAVLRALIRSGVLLRTQYAAPLCSQHEPMRADGHRMDCVAGFTGEEKTKEVTAMHSLRGDDGGGGSSDSHAQADGAGRGQRDVVLTLAQHALQRLNRLVWPYTVHNRTRAYSKHIEHRGQNGDGHSACVYADATTIDSTHLASSSSLSSPPPSSSFPRLSTVVAVVHTLSQIPSTIVPICLKQGYLALAVRLLWLRCVQHSQARRHGHSRSDDRSSKHTRRRRRRRRRRVGSCDGMATFAQPQLPVQQTQARKRAKSYWRRLGSSSPTARRVRHGKTKLPGVRIRGVWKSAVGLLPLAQTMMPRYDCCRVTARALARVLSYCHRCCTGQLVKITTIRGSNAESKRGTLCTSESTRTNKTHFRSGDGHNDGAARMGSYRIRCPLARTLSCAACVQLLCARHTFRLLYDVDVLSVRQRTPIRGGAATKDSLACAVVSCVLDSLTQTLFPCTESTWRACYHAEDLSTTRACKTRNNTTLELDKWTSIAISALPSVLRTLVQLCSHAIPRHRSNKRSLSASSSSALCVPAADRLSTDALDYPYVLLQHVLALVERVYESDAENVAGALRANSGRDGRLLCAALSESLRMLSSLRLNETMVRESRIETLCDALGERACALLARTLTILTILPPKYTHCAAAAAAQHTQPPHEESVQSQVAAVRRVDKEEYDRREGAVVDATGEWDGAGVAGMFQSLAWVLSWTLTTKKTDRCNHTRNAPHATLRALATVLRGKDARLSVREAVDVLLAGAMFSRAWRLHEEVQARDSDENACRGDMGGMSRIHVAPSSSTCVCSSGALTDLPLLGRARGHVSVEEVCVKSHPGPHRHEEDVGSCTAAVVSPLPHPLPLLFRSLAEAVCTALLTDRTHTASHAMSLYRLFTSANGVYVSEVCHALLCTHADCDDDTSRTNCSSSSSSSSRSKENKDEMAETEGVDSCDGSAYNYDAGSVCTHAQSGVTVASSVNADARAPMSWEADAHGQLLRHGLSALVRGVGDDNAHRYYNTHPCSDGKHISGASDDNRGDHKDDSSGYGEKADACDRTGAMTTRSSGGMRMGWRCRREVARVVLRYVHEARQTAMTHTTSGYASCRSGGEAASTRDATLCRKDDGWRAVEHAHSLAQMLLQYS